MLFIPFQVIEFKELCYKEAIYRDLKQSSLVMIFDT